MDAKLDFSVQTMYNQIESKQTTLHLLYLSN
jgi:hypothetical protein